MGGRVAGCTCCGGASCCGKDCHSVFTLTVSDGNDCELMNSKTFTLERCEGETQWKGTSVTNCGSISRCIVAAIYCNEETGLWSGSITLLPSTDCETEDTPCVVWEFFDFTSDCSCEPNFLAGSMDRVQDNECEGCCTGEGDWELVFTVACEEDVEECCCEPDCSSCEILTDLGATLYCHVTKTGGNGDFLVTTYTLTPFFFDGCYTFSGNDLAGVDYTPCGFSEVLFGVTINCCDGEFSYSLGSSLDDNSTDDVVVPAEIVSCDPLLITGSNEDAFTIGETSCNLEYSWIINETP